MAAVSSSGWGNVQAPSLEKGATIILDGGKLSFRKAREYRRVHKKDADPIQLKFIVRETQRVGTEEYYLDECGLREASYGGEGHVAYFGYAAADSGQAYMAANVIVPEDGKDMTYFLRLRYNSDERVAHGAGDPADLSLSQQDGNTYRGTIRAVFYRFGDRDGTISFDRVPVTIILPSEGETLPDPEPSPSANSGGDSGGQQESTQPSESTPPSASSEEPAAATAQSTPSAPAAKTDSEAPAQVQSASADARKDSPEEEATHAGLPLPADKLEEIIHDRLSIMVTKPVNEELMEKFYAETVTRLTDGKKVPRQDIIKATRKLVSNWPRRGVSLIQAGTSDKQLELLIVFSFSDGKGKESAYYGRITLTFDEKGKVNGMAELFTPDKQQFSPGITPFEYKGEKDVLIVE